MKEKLNYYKPLFCNASNELGNIIFSLISPGEKTEESNAVFLENKVNFELFRTTRVFFGSKKGGDFSKLMEKTPKFFYSPRLKQMSTVSCWFSQYNNYLFFKIKPLKTHGSRLQNLTEPYMETSDYIEKKSLQLITLKESLV